ncbi:unnamed protein product, partial [Allacma fusca]
MDRKRKLVDYQGPDKDEVGSFDESIQDSECPVIESTTSFYSTRITESEASASPKRKKSGSHKGSKETGPINRKTQENLAETRNSSNSDESQIDAEEVTADQGQETTSNKPDHHKSSSIYTKNSEEIHAMSWRRITVYSRDTKASGDIVVSGNP